MHNSPKPSIAPRLEKEARREKMALPPQPLLERPPEVRLNDFEEIIVPFSAEQAIAEASRCLFCPGASCANACLLGNDIPGAMWLISQGDFFGRRPAVPGNERYAGDLRAGVSSRAIV